MRTLTAFARNDALNLLRDAFLAYILVMPYALVLLGRWFIPVLTGWLQDRFAFDVVPLYPLVVGFMFVLQGPMMFGIVIGLMMLDERDEDTLTALRVTPFPVTHYALYRIALAAALGIAFVLVAPLLTGVMPLAVWPATVPIAICAGLLGAASALTLATFAGNKVEGIALMKGIGLFLVGPLVAYFIPSNWQLLLGVLPSYWPVKAFWTAWAGGPFWPYLLVGLVYLGGLCVWLMGRFRKKIED
ncbi:MAG: hypothetical protein KIT87_16180 [Anaerolineae bacterium]|nr:hypothetical protein [Anaerolineae bacterium]